MLALLGQHIVHWCISPPLTLATYYVVIQPALIQSYSRLHDHSNLFFANYAVYSDQ